MSPSNVSVLNSDISVETSIASNTEYALELKLMEYEELSKAGKNETDSVAMNKDCI